MLSSEQQDFYSRWLQKADNITNDDIASIIDKYVTLFINYNFLYNIIPKKKAQETGKARENIGDRKGATIYTVNFLGSDFISTHLAQHDLYEQIERLVNAMQHFNFHLNKGKPQPKKDKALINRVKSSNTDIKILSLMETLYYIRCNIVHGEKGLYQYQEILLLPAIKLLRGIIPFVYNRLNA